MWKRGPRFHSEIGIQARDLLYKDYLDRPRTHWRWHRPFFDWRIGFSFPLDKLAPGLRTIFSCVIPDLKNSKVELQYLHDHVRINGGIGLTANPIINFSGVMGSSVFSIGTYLSYDTASQDFTKCNAGLSFTSADLIASLTFNKESGTLNASCYHTLSSMTNTAVGAELAYSFSRNENTLTIGTQHALNSCTLVKVRGNSYGKASALIKHELWPVFSLTIAGEVDTGAVKSANFGFSLVFKP